MTNKEIAVSFLTLVASGKVREAYEQHVASTFIHHNPFFQGDRESLILAMEEDAAQNPDKSLEVKHAIAEDDLVTVHSHMKQQDNTPGYSLVHIFRLDENKIVELWDITQPVPEESVNEYGAF
ncbi:nuclear transport factor 2 family protein [Ornithinibacillus halophilus]|uniref:Predicted SnoaL-like aldol condensation-catalyzing enzyme n=1 Tax=Ornithinibacillus halophilus TaxID=930117 RepID=A0A1M5KLD7_9BACI|nr:nuclear transport factor 2 family protein [Ornithinibacillus halophilus]SHG53515.1 Predicted SnoaL-like aldol condensation-catalyzing enzyme [Ornithinibacillus halophilus]